MNFSESELTVLELLWDGECLDENGEIMASNHPTAVLILYIHK